MWPLAVARSRRPSLSTSRNVMPKPSKNRLGALSPTAAVASANITVSQVAVERRRFAEEVGDGQVGPAVAVEVAAGDAHARLVASLGVARHAGQVADLLESQAAPGCGTGDWPSCRWPRTGRSGRRRRGRRRPRRAPGRRGSTIPAAAVTSTNRPPSLRNRWSAIAGNPSGRQET